MLLFAQEGLERVASRRHNSRPAGSSAATERVFRCLEKHLKDPDYVPGFADLIRLIKFRQELGETRQVRIRVGWVQDGHD
jgi:hypothetical protein